MYAADLRSLLARAPSLRRAGLDRAGVESAWGLADAPERTCVNGVRALPPGTALVARGDALVVVAAARPAAGEALDALLVAAASRALASSRRPVVALGGGVDAPLAVLAARRAGATVTEALHLAIPGSSYDESREARELAAALGLVLHEVTVSIADLARELPHAVALAETPLYNLHPVSRALLARAALARGYDALITGDGADQAARGAAEAADYVPIVAAITRGSGLGLASPFLDDAVVEHLVYAREPGKMGLRELVVAWGLRRSLADRPKVPAFAPPLPRAAFPAVRALARLGGALGRSLAWSDDDRANVRCASLAAFVAALELEVDAPLVAEEVA
jgi:asparagine synthase (glutamine-hydrolysing)